MEFAMNFFEHQDRARRKTGMLVWLFVVAVAGLIAGTYVLIMSLYLGGLEQASLHNSPEAENLLPYLSAAADF